MKLYFLTYLVLGLCQRDCVLCNNTTSTEFSGTASAPDKASDKIEDASAEKAANETRLNAIKLCIL